MESADLWKALAQGDLTARDRLLNEHLGLVHHVARQLSRTLAVEANFDELVSAGAIGLMNALDAFDTSRGLAFSTFAAPRIRGAILDELRRHDHVSRSVRRKSRDIAAARESLTRTLGSPPDDRQLAEHMGIDLDILWRWQSEVEGIFHVPLDTPTIRGDAKSPSPGDYLTSEPEQGVEDEINLREEVSLLRDAILQLKEQERVVLSLYYLEELKLHEIAAILDLTESRISQIRSKAISRLRTQLSSLREQVA
jgi:RNA polymerase sigma factor for flagellar operon FliA